ncbi:hypothetical protein [Sinanaerobacter sp. ZZT-01]|uniref:hypothetical protein n=1 Tax=Sinanaerobacter sp. ZZT-01 TaxID=3111540 RepID=UPI002D765EE0|nr:hypothetical protein [Sinanaerobacter sp. ZZT-01]WRR93371.1 hypothetical protein U5921_15280 [Sinanaerobacter sp. ZZT-01]WRR94254.1 hypothetical protein U5921_03795 [Sinanaerobacter sp. ZZT-01]
MRNLCKDKRGDLLITTLAIFVLLLGMGTFVAEYLKVHGMHDHVETELNRAVNLSIKEAMYDSYRQDYLNKLDPDVAKDKFYRYLHEDLDLDSNFEKHQPGQKKYAYKVEIKDLEIDGENAKMKVKAVANVPCVFVGLPDWQLPINVGSRNMRVDGR